MLLPYDLLTEGVNIKYCNCSLCMFLPYDLLIEGVNIVIILMYVIILYLLTGEVNIVTAL